jgi:DNA-binding HxlR family transcriptional regulator
MAGVLFGKGRGAILGLLYGHPDRSFFYREITRQLNGLSVGTIQRELDTLSQLELVTRSTVGKLGADAKLISKMKTLSKKRNATA